MYIVFLLFYSRGEDTFPPPRLEEPAEASFIEAAAEPHRMEVQNDHDKREKMEQISERDLKRV